MKTNKKPVAPPPPKRRGTRLTSLPKSRYGGGLASIAQSCSPVSSGHYGGNVAAEPNRDYLTMVVQRIGGEWMYVRINQHCLDCVHFPVVFDVSEGRNLLELWKRVVIDGAIPWEDSVETQSLRIVSYRVHVEDETLNQFNNDAELEETMRMSALSKLSDSEARLLGLAHHKAKQSIMHNPEFHRDDSKLLTNLCNTSGSLAVSNILNGL